MITPGVCVLSARGVMRAMIREIFVRAVPGMRADTGAFFGASAQQYLRTAGELVV